MAYFLGYYVPSILDGRCGSSEPAVELPQWRLDYEKFVESVHIARQPCPGSCGGETCFNRHCGANNSGYTQAILKELKATSQA